jgi:hypothetical protein
MNSHECDFCKKTFVKEITLLSHSCEKKQRWFNKDSVESRISFLAWNRFYTLANLNKNKDFYANFRNFIDSKYYNSFYKFGKYIVSIDAVESGKFIDYVIKNNLPIDKWTHHDVYETYIRQLISQESADHAIERTIKLIDKWGIETNNLWTDFFRIVNPGQLILWLKGGRISPWVIYNIDSAADFFNRCTPEQLAIIKDVAPISVWKVKFNNNKETCDIIRETLKKSGM